MAMGRDKLPGPIQPGGSGKQTVLAVLLAAIVAFAVWGWMQDVDLPDPPPRPAHPVAQEAPPPPPRPAPPPVVVAPVVPGGSPARADLAGVIGTDDYPADAIRREEQGTTAFRLTIDATGRPRQCDVTESSGSATLDQTTCRIFLSRVRATPATDGNGVAVTGTISSRVRWVLPEG
ncbi:energy transducer TonB [Sphingomonas astaxanthinifaciens]|uniref:TonB C-terminal domain-containing protein n=1 Tax=Sphingomonas astaxanthinifaciens DSM 22298 TaxID=1123267 RepID=A0ABQ5Z7M3_9SPHN|nr:energy transducer TonB [Sphingomonas astaxanthinifaciens]GLR47972.1 hypothetical protein GCM10007925_16850 [Sphingomonas astaxanthinifaciens DSM 22298]